MTRKLGKIFPERLEFNIQSLTAEEDRVIAEAESTSNATLIDRSSYTNSDVFIFRIRAGLIASVAEHFNAKIVIEKLVPLVDQLSCSKSPL
ncbi:nuclear transport factor 2 family protein [Halioxenophilus aromaticivorans]|uniref:Uncharacterized protein n=1 Tax=Halioxenophilus aromaticivorans TaxID=1306992 RepID=A0AAV3U3U3_9ALTE